MTMSNICRDKNLAHQFIWRPAPYLFFNRHERVESVNFMVSVYGRHETSDDDNGYGSIVTRTKYCLSRFGSVIDKLGKFNGLVGKRLYVNAGHRPMERDHLIWVACAIMHCWSTRLAILESEVTAYSAFAAWRCAIFV